MKNIGKSAKHVLFVINILVSTCLLLLGMRHVLGRTLLLFEQIVLSSLITVIFWFGLVVKFQKAIFPSESLRTVSYLTLIGFLASLVLLPNSLLNVDRSRSLYVLSWVDQGEVSESNGKIVLDVASPESADIAGISLRLNEQQKRGLITRSGSKYVLTKSGNLLVGIANLSAKLFKLENWQKNKK